MTPFVCTIRIHKFNGSFATVEVFTDAGEGKEEKLAEATITSLAGLEPILLKIRARLLKEGRLLPDGTIVVKMDEKKEKV